VCHHHRYREFQCACPETEIPGKRHVSGISDSSA
jgi:hypothetical protein